MHVFMLVRRVGHDDVEVGRMEKVELGTADGTTENVERIAELFPQVVTEAENPAGGGRS